MKRQRRSITAATNTPSAKAAQKILKEIKQLNNDLDDLYMLDEAMYDNLDLASLHDEIQGADMFISHQINKL